MHTTNELLEILLLSKPIKEILDKTNQLEIPNWHLAGGCVAQTVWNFITKQELDANIKDYDLGYFDANDLSAESEKVIQEKAKILFPDINIEIANQARVHLWYEEEFGVPINPYTSAEDVINTAMAFTSHIVSITKLGSEYLVYAPYGVEDIFSMTLRKNPHVVVSDEFFNKKVEKWKKFWPELKVV